MTLHAPKRRRHQRARRVYVQTRGAKATWHRAAIFDGHVLAVDSTVVVACGSLFGGAQFPGPLSTFKSWRQGPPPDGSTVCAKCFPGWATNWAPRAAASIEVPDEVLALFAEEP